MDELWAALLASAYFLWRRQVRGAWILFAVAVSHWILDVVSHRPDMPVAPGIRQVYGLGLWNSLPATLIVEGGMWVLAILFYVRARHLWTLRIGIVVLTLAWLAIGWAYWINHARVTGKST